MLRDEILPWLALQADSDAMNTQGAHALLAPSLLHAWRVYHAAVKLLGRVFRYLVIHR
jgi:hypothetical protein